MPAETTIILTIFLGATLTQLIFWGLIFRKLAVFTPVETDINAAPFASVIICARNEAENLQKNLPLFLNQTYRSYEVIIVNDNSTDNTREVVLHFVAKTRNLRLIDIKEESPPGKKAALARGIEAARSNYLVFSDADCQPAGNFWLATCVAHLNTTSQIGLGFGPYRTYPGMLNRFIRFETAYTALQYFSLALRGLPYMGVGRNLCYTRFLYEKANGFRDHAHIASGDDDLFVNAAANPSNTTIILEPDAFVYSEPKTTWKAYFRQKSRHVSTGTQYRMIHKLILGVLSMSHLLHYVGAVSCIAMGVPWFWILPAIVIRTGILFRRWQQILPRLKQEDLLAWVIPLDALFVFYYIALAPALWFGKRNHWR